MKRSIITLLLFSVLCTAAFAQNESDFKTDGKGTITGYEGWDVEIVIPAQIGGIPIMFIGNSAFKEMGLTRVTLPASVTRIGSEAFAVNKLTSVIIPDGVYIDKEAFSSNKLTNLTIGNGVYIGQLAFQLNKLTKLTMGNNGFVNNRAFESNKIVDFVLGSNITFSSDTFDRFMYFEYMCNDRKAGTYINTSASSYNSKKDGDFEFIETKYGAVITRHSGTDANRLIIPGQLGGVKVKGIHGAFTGQRISRVQFPDSITFIGEKAFTGYQFTSITIPASVTSIGEAAFSSTFNTPNLLTSVTIPNSVTSIGQEAFNYCKLTSISISDSVIFIGARAFSYNQLTSVTVPNSVTSLEDNVFGHNQLTSVTIPNSVTSIDTQAFTGNKLTSVTIPNSVVLIGDGAFMRNQLTSVVIPNSVTSIGSHAFSRNQLTSVTVPPSIAFINDDAFNSNQHLGSFTIGSDVNIFYSGLPCGLGTVYNREGKKAGTYEYKNNNWVLK